MSYVNHSELFLKGAEKINLACLALPPVIVSSLSNSQLFIHGLHKLEVISRRLHMHHHVNTSVSEFLCGRDKMDSSLKH